MLSRQVIVILTVVGVIVIAFVFLFNKDSTEEVQLDIPAPNVDLNQQIEPSAPPLQLDPN